MSYNYDYIEIIENNEMKANKQERVVVRIEFVGRYRSNYWWVKRVDWRGAIFKKYYLTFEEGFKAILKSNRCSSALGFHFGDGLFIQISSFCRFSKAALSGTELGQIKSSNFFSFFDLFLI